MQYSSALLYVAFAVTSVYSHGVVTEVQGANNVNMPALSVIDGTPRDSPSPFSGAEADTSILNPAQAAAMPLGKTSKGAVDAKNVMAAFMSGPVNVTARAIHEASSLYRRAAVTNPKGVATPKGTVEGGVAAAAGVGAMMGLPTTDDNGMISMTIHQVNQDGAGPFSAMVDPTSGGTDAAAFKPATMPQNVPGIGIAGISTAAVMDFPAKMQMPAGMTCSGTIGDATNVCVAKMSNGPPQFFGGSIAFTQSSAAKKRAIEYNMKMRRSAQLARRSEE
ncbi:uncharacterized protein L3040_004082 [Drepanopeziza brunnea f. sp. 'multigermtubi']|uniref:Cell surface protein n=1 Tax=Marssonina brunnea f. sp. multigermtubi (strain MB_m1) TaxID=1072389 RepID=K1XJD5_MARBU|nr:uncharacterized protein MBM_09300 [Drepanopeziza brunnea f. sp. 'multigermtubi' MB_m1]EKD12544.1 hypothetical protein MBM_09300 [Drepanopeziza brunnea f. sp. 'multigermtubi' MB_m1]KAJ5042683.1 hypothetical protein L3040_004082 [Drepanopeziza brunnea f. sp. 'multigermtubi']